IAVATGSSCSTGMRTATSSFISDSKRAFSAGRSRRRVNRAYPCAPRSWRCCWTASTGRRSSAAGATTGPPQRRDEQANHVERAGGQCRALFSCPPGNNYGLQCVPIGMSLPHPAAAGLPPTDAPHLPDDLATLKQMVLELLASLHERDRDI